MAAFFRLVPVIPIIRRENKAVQCEPVRREHKVVQCNLALIAKMQAEKEKKDALKQKGTQTLPPQRGKNVQSQTKLGKFDSRLQL
jgi:hypothetical protein